MIRKTRSTVGVVTLSSLGVFLPSALPAQHGPGSHGARSAPVYDPKSEATFTGTVADVKTGRSALRSLVRIHTLGLGQKGAKETRLFLTTDTGRVEVQLGPTAFLTEKKVEIRKGDTLEVTGSRVPMAKSHVVLAREIRKGDNAWALRDATGQPLWSSVPTEARGFWTEKKVLLAVVVVKVVALATVLRH